MEVVTALSQASTFSTILCNGARYTRAKIQINADPKWTCQVQIASTR